MALPSPPDKRDISFEGLTSHLPQIKVEIPAEVMEKLIRDELNSNQKYYRGWRGQYPPRSNFTTIDIRDAYKIYKQMEDTDDEEKKRNLHLVLKQSGYPSDIIKVSPFKYISIVNEHHFRTHEQACAII